MPHQWTELERQAVSLLFGPQSLTYCMSLKLSLDLIRVTSAPVTRHIFVSQGRGAVYIYGTLESFQSFANCCIFTP
jgi:hypothetical protein